ncbi:hypothetical protein DFJ74DRAFT_679540 [Hyaloraphidium curvatum]|nr:hypothetical protein DFJ74DRAFT_679540 [Hyaloraphidium curvatum]
MPSASTSLPSILPMAWEHPGARSKPVGLGISWPSLTPPLTPPRRGRSPSPSKEPRFVSDFTWRAPLWNVLLVVVLLCSFAALFVEHAGPSHAAAPTPPRKRVGIVMLATAETGYTLPSISNKLIYSHKHGYPLHLHTTTDSIAGMPQGTWIMWAKIYAVLAAFNASDAAEMIWMIDSDTLVTNLTVRLEDILPGFDAENGPEMVISKDCNMINAGSVFFRNSAYMRHFLREMIRYHDERDPTSNEQGVLHTFLSTNYLGIADSTVFVDQHLINAYPPEIPCQRDKRPWQKGDFLLHVAGASYYPMLLPEVPRAEKAKKLMEKYYREVAY